MNANQLNFHGVPDGNGGVKMVPRKNSPVDRALRRIYGVTFHDQPIPLPPMNNLGMGIAAPRLDPDFHQMARNASSQDRKRIFAAQRQRDARRGFDAAGNACDCGDTRYRGRDQGPSPTKAVQAVTRGVNRTSEFGEEFNRDQLPDDEYGPDEHQEPDGDEPGVQVLGTLPPLEPGQIYSLYEEGDEVVLVSEPDLGERDDPDLQTNDRTYRHRVFGDNGSDPKLKRQNAVAKGYWLKDRAAKGYVMQDQAVENTLIRHKPGPGNKLVLRGPNEFGSYDLVLLSWSPEDDMMHEQAGAEELDDSDDGEPSAASWLPQPEKSDPLQLQQPTPTFRDRRMPEAVTIRSMNASAKAFWQKH